MHRVFRKLRARNVPVERLCAVEIFGKTGTSHTVDYVSRVRSLEVWEIDPAFESDLKRNLPRATVRITDSFEELKRSSSRFDLIVLDNPSSTFGARCEHFDAFPGVFRIASDRCILIANVIPRTNESARRTYPYLFSEKHLARRAEFYQTDHPERLSFAEIANTYEELARSSGFNMNWWFVERRTFVYYFVFQIERGTAIPANIRSWSVESVPAR